MVKQLRLAISGGLIAGAFVGLCEALYILGGASTGEYGALLYATVLYGALGAGGGAGFGVGFAVLSLVKVKFVDHRVWALGFLGIFCGMGLVITRYIANKAVYLEQGVPTKGMLTILAIYGLLGLVGLWLGKLFSPRLRSKFCLHPEEHWQPMAAFCFLLQSFLSLLIQAPDRVFWPLIGNRMHRCKNVRICW